MLHAIKSCKFGLKECMVLQGTRALEICTKCAPVEKGKSLETGKDLQVPSNYVAKPKANVVQLQRRK